MNDHPVSKHAVAAEHLLTQGEALLKSRYVGEDDATRLHTACNRSLYALRCGARRRRYGPLRAQVRAMRARAASVLARAS